jgi:HlyD family secretion protein
MNYSAFFQFDLSLNLDNKCNTYRLSPVEEIKNLIRECVLMSDNPTISTSPDSDQTGNNPASFSPDFTFLDEQNVDAILNQNLIGRMSKPKKILSLLAIILILGLGALALYRYLAAKQDGAYITMTVTKATISNSVEATGTLEPVRKSEMGFKNDGTITAINVNPGDKVVKGQVLAEQDSDSLTTALQQAINTVEQDEISLKTSTLSYEAIKRTYDQQQKLAEVGAISQSDLDTAKDNLAKSELDVATARPNWPATRPKWNKRVPTWPRQR